MVSLPITIPSGATILVNVSDKVKHGQVLAKISPSEEHIINVAEMLRISAKKAASLLQVQPGDKVEVGELIAVRKNSFGLTAARLKSNVNGTVLRFDPETGILAVGNPSQQQEYELLCPIAGVVEVCHNDQIVIQTDENIVQGIGGVGKTARGQLVALSNTELTGSIIDKIIFAHEFDRDALIKAIGIGAAGIIAMKIDPVDMTYLQQKNLVVPIILVSEDKQKVLLKQVNKEVFLEGTTNIILLLA